MSSEQMRGNAKVHIERAFLAILAGDPSRIRTCNPRSRNPLLYPVELWDRWRPYNIANMKNPLSRQARPEPESQTKRQSKAVDRCVWSALNAMLRRRRPSAWQRVRFDKCCMRLFRYLVPPP